MEVTNRPVWVTIVASLLALLGLCALVYGAWSLVVDVRLSTRLTYAAVCLWFGASALLSAIGLWGMRNWTVSSLSSWVVACLLIPWVPYVNTVQPDSPIDGIIASALMALVVTPVWLAARRALRRRSATPPGAA